MINEKQHKIIFAKDQNILVYAGAGTGKTFVLTQRINYLITSKKVLKEEILCLTFTKKAAMEMQFKLNNQVEVFTFHAFCLNTLQTCSKGQFLLFDKNQFLFTQKELLQIANYKNKNSSFRPQIYNSYQNYLKQNNLVDFNDLELLFLKLPPTIICVMKDKYRYIFIDEWQDTSLVQYKIITLLTGFNTSVFCVGDPDQSLYSWRGSNKIVLKSYICDYNPRIYTLDINYRSSSTIVNLANFIISYNKYRFPKKLIANNPEKSKIKILKFKNCDEESIFIINKIKDLMKTGLSLGDIAIIYRNNGQSITIKEKLFRSFLIIKTINNNGISLLTIHQAKGLEFNIVFLIGLEKYQFPSNYAKCIHSFEEERRLLFVAITRAKDYLFITHCQKRNNTKNKPSPFLNTIAKFGI